MAVSGRSGRDASLNEMNTPVDREVISIPLGYRGLVPSQVIRNDHLSKNQTVMERRI
jgi:hypothetical protein